MKVIAISGRAASGKDSTALSISRKAVKEGARVEIISLAEALKKVTSDLWNIDPEYLKTYAGKAKMRSKLIQLGGYVRDIDPNTWVQIVVDRIKRLKTENVQVVLIPDLRFLNELYKLIAEFGPDVSFVRVEASAKVRLERMGPERAREYVELGIQNDISERQFDFLEKPLVWFDQEALSSIQTLQTYTRFITNDGTFEDLDRAVEAWAENQPTREQAEAAMKAAYKLSRDIGPEAQLVLGL